MNSFPKQDEPVFSFCCGNLHFISIIILKSKIHAFHTLRLRHTLGLNPLVSPHTNMALNHGEYLFMQHVQHLDVQKDLYVEIPIPFVLFFPPR